MAEPIHTPNNMTPHRMPVVDALRLVAALMVLCFHYLFRGHAGAEGYSPLAFPDAAPFAQYGFLGVHWFFMISGLVIAYSATGRTATQFAAARASRLIPGAWAAITLLFLVFTLFPMDLFLTNPIIWLTNLTFAPQIFHQPLQIGAFWTIQIEIIFYGWVAVLVALNLWRRSLIMIAAWLAITALNLFAMHSKILEYLFLTKYGPLFCLGILLFYVRQHRWQLVPLGLMVLSLILAVINLLDDAYKASVTYHVIYDPVILISILVAGFALLAAVMHVRLAERWQRFCFVIGGLTYPLYLVHEQLGYRMFWALHDSGINPWVQFAIAACSAIAIAFAIWAIIEQPLIPRLRALLQNCLARFLPVRHKAS